MRWDNSRESDNVVDARRGGGVRMAAGGGLGMAVLALVVYLLGGDPRVVTNNARPAPPPDRATSSTATSNDPDVVFVKRVLGDTEDTWNAYFQKHGQRYEEPQLVLFRGQVESACGFAQAAMGPFYCPRDHRVYIDLAFYDELQERFHAPGDFAQAYVIAHEVGHHVQNQLGIFDQVQEARQGSGRREANALSVRTELQADCFAGIWAHDARESRNRLEPGDLEEALNAASQIGDDKLQKRSQGYVVPESFTHGSAAQRMTWFKRGYESGSLEACDTFKG
jgi:predicted metalloprotease